LSLRRSPDPSRRYRRLVVGGVTAALLVVPGVALAAPPADPLDPVTGTVTDIVGGITGGITGGVPQSSAPAVQETPTVGAATPSGPSLDPAQLTALLAQLGVTKECATAIQDDLVATLTSIPATVQQLIGLLGDHLTELQQDPANGPALLQDALADLLGGALGGGAAATSTGVAGLPLLSALEDLVQDFLTVCLPQPAPATSAAPTSAAPVVETTAPVVAPAPTTTTSAPVAYLGYAPTGVDQGSDDDGSPLALLGGGVLLLGGGAAGTWMWSRRAASSRG
jgi:hypothetical protein